MVSLSASRACFSFWSFDSPVGVTEMRRYFLHSVKKYPSLDEFVMPVSNSRRRGEANAKEPSIALCVSLSVRIRKPRSSEVALSGRAPPDRNSVKSSPTIARRYLAVDRLQKRGQAGRCTDAAKELPVLAQRADKRMEVLLAQVAQGPRPEGLGFDPVEDLGEVFWVGPEARGEGVGECDGLRSIAVLDRDDKRVEPREPVGHAEPLDEPVVL